VSPLRVRAKAIIVEAMRHDGTPASANAIHTWTGHTTGDHWNGDNSVTIRWQSAKGDPIHALPGEWVVREFDGRNYFALPPALFDELYEIAVQY
jgi:hypothetical protein